MIAIARRDKPAFGAPNLDGLKAALGSPKLQAAGAAALFAGCAAAVVMLLGPASGKPTRIHLTSVFAQAPAGWREGLPKSSMAWQAEDVLRLSDGAPAEAGPQAAPPQA